MSEPVVIIGIGEVGGVLARGLLKSGHPVYPVIRRMNLKDEEKKIPRPLGVIVTVHEDDFRSVIEDIPGGWRDSLILVQNELLPADWKDMGISNPTVLIVWFEKKHPLDYKILMTSFVYGHNSELIRNSLEAINIPSRQIASEGELLYELVRKNLYILTTNIAGIITGGTVRDLQGRHHEFTMKVAQDVMDIQDFLTGTKNNRERLLKGLQEAFEADLDHKCTGRTAHKRLVKQLHYAKAAGIPASILHKIAVEKL